MQIRNNEYIDFEAQRMSGVRRAFGTALSQKLSISTIPTITLRGTRLGMACQGLDCNARLALMSHVIILSWGLIANRSS